MESLEKYADFFEAAYPDYADARYSKIRMALSLYDGEGAEDFVMSSDFERAVALMLPVILIKNYKSQIPFPENIPAVIKAFFMVKTARVNPDDIFEQLRPAFSHLLSLQGFQLPTVSAVLHFFHPAHFPIVDRNVQSACELLIRQHPESFAGYAPPVMPAPGTSIDNKLKKYLDFIRVIDRIMELHPPGVLSERYREMDKALMVLGVSELRNKAEALSL